MKKLIDKYKNLKLAAKRVFLGLLVLCLISSFTGIGSIFAYADGTVDPIITEPGDPEPGDPEPGDPEPGNPEPGNPEPGNPEPGNPEPGDQEPGDPEPGDPEPGDPEPGDPEPGDPEPGTPEPGTPEPGNPDEGEHTEHTYIYTSNEDGTHTVTCSECDYEVTEDCTYEEAEEFEESRNAEGSEEVLGEIGITRICKFCGYKVTEEEPEEMPLILNSMLLRTAAAPATDEPVITEISTFAVEGGTKIVLRGTCTSLIKFRVIARVKDGTEKEPTIAEFTEQPVEETIRPAAKDGEQEETGTYVAEFTFDANYDQNFDPTKTYIFYCLAEGGGRYSEIRSKEGYSQEISLDIEYNGDELQSWYNTDVVITASGYKISEVVEGPANNYRFQYTMTGSGTVTKKLAFQNESTTSIVKIYDVTVNIDRVAPSATYSAGGFSTNTFRSTGEIAYYSGKNTKASISASDNMSGVASIKYYVCDEFFPNVTTLLDAMWADGKKFRNYASGVKISLTDNKENYVYVNVVDNAGNETYIATGQIISDTTIPSLKTIEVGKKDSGSEKIVALAGTDTISGIDRFRLMYQEKTSDNMRAPTKDEIFNNGIRIATTISEDESYGTTYTISDLDDSKTYIFYAAAIDRAGNISSVQSYTKAPSASSQANAAPAAAQKSAAASKTPSAGLTPAPSGIAGGAPSKGGSEGGGSGSSLTDATGNTEESANPLDKEIVRVPYIADATGSTKIGLQATGGWDIIISELKKADYGAVIDVEMSGLGVIPAEVFNTIAGKEITVKFLMPQDVVWVVAGKDIKGNIPDDRNMAVKVGSRNIPTNLLEDITGSNPHFEFDIAYEGDFGFTATLSFPVGKSNSGLYANLYHYKDDDKDFHLEESSVVTPDGYAEFKVTHASSFSVVITGAPLLSDHKAIEITKEQNLTDSESLVSDDATLRIPDLFGLRGKVRVYLLLIALISAALCVMILFLPALQLPGKVGNIR